jgi:uncharacterized protein YegP (UPF0339 family)
VSGTFELLSDKLGQFRVLLLSDNREILAASVPFADKAGAVIGIASVREIAGTGLIVAPTPSSRPRAAPGSSR